MLCEYGCNQEARYQFKNGKWCCSSHSSKCPFLKNKISLKVKTIWDDNNSIYHKDEYKINRKEYYKTRVGHGVSDKQKEIMKIKQKENWDDLNHIFNSKKFRKKLSEKHKEIWNDPDSSYNSKERSDKISVTMKKLLKDPEYLKKYMGGIKNSPNKQEIKILNIIESISSNFKFVGDFSFWIGGKNPDFIDKQNNEAQYHQQAAKKAVEEWNNFVNWELRQR